MLQQLSEAWSERIDGNQAIVAELSKIDRRVPEDVKPGTGDP